MRARALTFQRKFSEHFHHRKLLTPRPALRHVDQAEDRTSLDEVQRTARIVTRRSVSQRSTVGQACALLGGLLD